MRRFWVLGTLLGCALAASGWTLATLPVFRLHELTVTGNARVTRDEIVARAAVDPSENVWFLQPREIERRIEAIPYIKRARVHRRPPGRIWIDVSERRPEACVRDAAGHEFQVDDDLRVLEEVCTADDGLTYDLRGSLQGAGPGTFVHDPELVALAADARSLSPGDRYRDFSHDGFGQLQATMQDGIEIRFGDDDDLDRKQRLIAPILVELGPRTATVRAVDLRAPSTPVVQFR
jgi:cell division septal protein FtsQ